MRIDPASRVFGMRFNLLLSVGAVRRRDVCGSSGSAGPAGADPLAARTRRRIRVLPDSDAHAPSVVWPRTSRRNASDHDVPPRRRSRPAPCRRRRSTARATPRCARSTTSTSTSSAARSPRSWDRRVPASRRCCTASPDSTAHGGAGVPRRHRARPAPREGAHAGPPRQDRLRLPGVQPDPDADRAREHHAADVARRSRARPGVARPRRSTPSASATGSRTARPSSRAASSSASRSRARSRASPRSSSPTSPPATSTRKASAEILELHAQGRRRVRPDDRDGHARPDRRRVRRPRRVPRRRHASSTRCANPTADASSTRCASSATELARDVEGHPSRGSPPTSCASCSPALAVDARRRVHVGHARAHRRRSADLRRPRSPTSTRGTDAQVRGTEASGSDFGGGARARRSSSVARTTVRAVDGVDGRRRPRCRRPVRADRRQATARRSAAARARPRSGSVVDPTIPTLNPFHLVAGRPAAGRRRRDRHRQGHGRQGRARASATRVTVLTGRPPSEYTIVGIARFGTADSLRRRVDRAVHAARGAAHRRNAAISSAEIGVVGEPGLSPGGGPANVAQDARPRLEDVEVITGAELTKENQDDDRQVRSASSTASCWCSRSSRCSSACFIIYNTFTIVVAQRTREMALLRAIGAATPTGDTVGPRRSGRRRRGRVRTRLRPRHPARGRAQGAARRDRLRHPGQPHRDPDLGGCRFVLGRHDRDRRLRARARRGRHRVFRRSPRCATSRSSAARGSARGPRSVSSSPSAAAP